MKKQDGKQKININLNNDNYKRIEAVATMMEISVEVLTERALDSFLYTVKQNLNHIEEHVFPNQIIFE